MGAAAASQGCRGRDGLSSLVPVSFPPVPLPSSKSKQEKSAKGAPGYKHCWQLLEKIQLEYFKFLFRVVFLCLLCFQSEDPTWNFGLIPLSAGACPCGFRHDFEPLFLNSKHPKKWIFGISRFPGGLVEILFWVTLQSSPHAEV